MGERRGKMGKMGRRGKMGRTGRMGRIHNSELRTPNLEPKT
jgi:hypothetical protein